MQSFLLPPHQQRTRISIPTFVYSHLLLVLLPDLFARRKRHSEGAGDADERQGSDGVRQEAEGEDRSADLELEVVTSPATHPSLSPAIPTVFHRCCLLLPFAHSPTRRKGTVHSFLLTPLRLRPVPLWCRLPKGHLHNLLICPAIHSLNYWTQGNSLLIPAHASCSSSSSTQLLPSSALFQSFHACSSSASIKTVHPLMTMQKRTTSLETQVRPFSEYVMDSIEFVRKCNLLTPTVTFSLPYLCV